MPAPDAPWRLSGDAVLALCRPRRVGRDEALAAGVVAASGFAVLFACRYDTSPVGPYVEMGVAEPARLGLRPGWCVTAMAATSTDARVAGRLSWGFPKQLAGLVWDDRGDGVRVEWPEAGLVMRAEPRGRRIPAWMPLRGLQRRGDGPVVVPGSIRGWLRRARAEVSIEGDDSQLAWLAGPHPAATLTGARFVVDVARAPRGALSTLRAPLRAPDPGAASMHTSRGA